MKKTLLLILFVTGFCFGQTYDQIEETYDNGFPKVIKTYKVSKSKLKLVKAVYWHPNGQKRYEGTYKDGNEDGIWTGWHENGQKEYEGTIKDGKEDGLITFWYENGQIEDEGNFTNGKKHGLFTKWNKIGQISNKTYFLNNMKDGKDTTYYLDDDYILSGVSKNKSGDIHTIIEYKQDKKHGIFLKYHEKKLVIKGTYKNDELIDEEYFE